MFILLYCTIHSRIAKMGRLSEFSPSLVIASIFSPYWMFMMVVPVWLYVRDESLRKFVARALGEMPVVQRIQAVFTKNPTAVAPVG